MQRCPFDKTKFKQTQDYLTHLWMAHGIAAEQAPIKLSDRSIFDVVAAVEERLASAIIVPGPKSEPTNKVEGHAYDERCTCHRCLTERFDRLVAQMDQVLA